MNRLKAIVEAVVAQLQEIDGGTHYNFSLLSGQIIQGYIGHDQAHRYPSVCVIGASLDGSDFADQRSRNAPFTVELLGYVQKEQDALSEALKFASDIETAIFTDETLGGLIWGLSTRLEVSALNNSSFGGVFVEIKGMTLKEKP
ncbi:MAG: hypothetical protein JRI95_13955 [Deltaproteobacteria bacterium]|nr:hypothetical protein [Deltaproteobacteria bacterium]MBW2084720.1 hypothetical protein [Deltaproteobacteria bacterium]